MIKKHKEIEKSKTKQHVKFFQSHEKYWTELRYERLRSNKLKVSWIKTKLNILNHVFSGNINSNMNKIEAVLICSCRFHVLETKVTPINI